MSAIGNKMQFTNKWNISIPISGNLKCYKSLIPIRTPTPLNTLIHSLFSDHTLWWEYTRQITFEIRPVGVAIWHEIPRNISFLISTVYVQVQSKDSRNLELFRFWFKTGFDISCVVCIRSKTYTYVVLWFVWKWYSTKNTANPKP